MKTKEQRVFEAALKRLERSGLVEIRYDELVPSFPVICDKKIRHPAKVYKLRVA